MRRLGVLATLTLLALGAMTRVGPSAQAQDPATVVFDILFRSTIHAPQVGDPAQAYVNGVPCGVGFVDGANPVTHIYNPIYVVPESCASPGDTVAFLVNGYMLAAAETYPTPQTSWDTVVVRTRLGPVVPARFAGLTALPPGTTVEARIGGTLCGTATVLPLGQTLRYYSLQVVPTLPAPFGTLGCGFPGAAVTIHAGGSPAATATWRSGFTLLNLP